MLTTKLSNKPQHLEGSWHQSLRGNQRVQWREGQGLWSRGVWDETQLHIGQLWDLQQAADPL